MHNTLEQAIETIRSKWAWKGYQPGVQGAANFIPMQDALLIVEILEKHGIDLCGFETFIIHDDGGIEPSMEQSMEGFSGNEASYACARRMFAEQAADGNKLFYEIFYDNVAARQVVINDAL